MDCGHYEQLMSRMLDEELAGEELKSLYSHLRACPDCRRIHAAYRSLTECLQEDLAEAPENLLPHVMAAVEAAGPHKAKKKTPWTGWLVTAACAALVIGLGAPLLSPRGSADLAQSEAYIAPAEAAPAAAAPAAFALTEEAAPEQEAKGADPEIRAKEAPAEAPDPAPEAPGPELAEVPAEAALLSLDGQADSDTDALAADALPDSASRIADNILCPVYDRQGRLLGHVQDHAALLALCGTAGEPLALTEFECDYNIEYNGLVYQFLVHEGSLWWRSDGESLLLPANGSEEMLLFLIQ